MAGNPATPEPAPSTPTKVEVPNFDGHHRLAHERRVGADVEAWCACGDNSGPTDRADARDWLHQHLEQNAA